MRNAARKLELQEATQRSGYVIGVEGPVCVVRTDGGERRARRAASCLLDAALGDRVLVALLEDGSAYVLAILEREGGPATISVGGDLALRVPGGRLDVVAAEGIGLTTPGDVAVAAGGVDMTAVDGRFGIERLAVIGERLLAEVASVKLLAGAVDAAFERLSQKAKRVYRSVEELDRLRAARVDYAADKSMHLRAENALVTASELVKVDGENIHLG